MEDGSNWSFKGLRMATEDDEKAEVTRFHRQNDIHQEGASEVNTKKVSQVFDASHYLHAMMNENQGIRWPASLPLALFATPHL